jgi:hypothetical protein
VLVIMSLCIKLVMSIYSMLWVMDTKGGDIGHRPMRHAHHAGVTQKGHNEANN